MKKYGYIYILILLIITIGIFYFCFISKREPLAIIGAMDDEINEFITNLDNKKHTKYSDFEIYTGNINKEKIVLAKSGVGKVNAATTTQYIIDKYKPKYIINTGLAGSISPDLKAGDILIASKMVQHDFDITAFGTAKGYMNTDIEPDKPTLYYSDKNLINDFINKSKDKNIKEGTIATGDIFVSDKQIKNNIRKEFNADLVDMERAAIAQTAQRNNIPVIILRAVSDELNDNEKEYKQNKQNIALKSALTVIEILNNK